MGWDSKDGFLRSTTAIRFHALLEKYFPERRVFLRSDSDTRFIRLRSGVQLAGFLGSSAIVAWAIIATAILLMDSIGSGNFREQAKRDQRTYEARLNFLAGERDTRAEEALAAQSRFNSALEQISSMQSELLASETRRRELETGIEVIQTTLRRTMKERDKARKAVDDIKLAMAESGGDGALSGANPALSGAIAALQSALSDTAAEREVADAVEAMRGSCTILVITHRGLLAELADRHLVMEAGRFVNLQS